MFAELDGVDPGTVAAGVKTPDVGMGTRDVTVTAGKKVGRVVGVEAVSEDVQAASRTKPDRNTGTSFMFIALSLTTIIDVKYKTAVPYVGKAA
jgi:hypothetical protein